MHDMHRSRLGFCELSARRLAAVGVLGEGGTIFVCRIECFNDSCIVTVDF